MAKRTTRPLRVNKGVLARWLLAQVDRDERLYAGQVELSSAAREQGVMWRAVGFGHGWPVRFFRYCHLYTELLDQDTLRELDRQCPFTPSRPGDVVIEFTDLGSGQVELFIRYSEKDRGLVLSLVKGVEARWSATGAGPPAEPVLGFKAPREEWFRWYHQMIDSGYRFTLRELAKKLGLAYDTVKHEHADYLAEHGEVSSREDDTA